MQKTLILMRHAKSDWYAGNHTDFDRPLNKRGRKDSDRMGRYLASIGIYPQEVLYSAANRTKETMQRVVKSAAWNELNLRSSKSLYLCSSEQLLQAIGQTSCAVNTLLVINHQPTCSDLVYQFCGQWVEMKTASFAILTSEVQDWGLLSMDNMRLLQHLSPAQI